MNIKIEADDEEAAHRKVSATWMLIFTDLVSLMLTFFVLLFSMSSVESDKWKSMTDALSQTLNPAGPSSELLMSSKYNIANLFRKRAVNLDYLGGVLEEAMANDPFLRNSQLIFLDDRLIIALPGDLLFPPGQSVLSEGARQALFNLGGVLSKIGNQIGVNGHTDPKAVKGDGYKSNWELSLARAIAVANSLKRSGYIEKIIAYGYADSHFSHLPEMSEEKRQALGRRVDIVVLPTVGE